MKIRMLETTDLNPLVELMRACGKSVSADELNRDLDEPGERIRENTFVCLVDGQIVGDVRLCFVRTAKETRYNVFCYGEVHPNFRRKGIGFGLYTTALKHLRVLASREGCSLTVVQHAPSDSVDQCSILSRAGFRESIRILGMELFLFKRNPMDVYDATLPAGYTIRPVLPSDAKSIVEVDNAAFHWRTDVASVLTEENVAYEIANEECEPDLHPVLLDREGDLIGFAHCTRSIEVSDSESQGEFDGRTVGTGHIHTIAVHPDFHGQRLGKALLHHCLRKMNELAVNRVTLSYELDNTSAAPHLYRLAGFTPFKETIRYKLEIE